MSVSDEQKAVRCGGCGEPIGVYEPMVVLAAGSARETSRAREPCAHEHAEACFHHDCYDPA
ncbi:MAG TPA: hypothetical protein VL979_08060 [Solirubrobacteraceae bacterium]|nr:hypothetical protein [Solirubrobacteraceae bacterium]